MLTDGDAHVRLAAVRVLGDSGEPAMVEAMDQIGMQQREQGDAVEHVEARTVRALSAGKIQEALTEAGRDTRLVFTHLTEPFVVSMPLTGLSVWTRPPSSTLSCARSVPSTPTTRAGAPQWRRCGRTWCGRISASCAFCCWADRKSVV